MLTSRNRKVGAGLGAGLSAALLLGTLSTSGASSHREAPLIIEDPVADNTDVYAFVAPDAPDHVTIVSNFIPFQEPAGGPNFYKWGRDVRYDIAVDNNGDAVDDVRYEFRFRDVFKNPDTFLNNTGPVVFEEGEYQNLNWQQLYSVTEVRNGHSRVLARDLLVPPNNIGPRSTPDYDELAAAAIHEIDLGDGQTMKVFAGQRDDVFPVDLGSIFDLGGLRPFNPAHLIPLREADGVSTTSGFNVHSLAIQVPTEHLTIEDQPVIGVHSTANRPQERTLYDTNRVTGEPLPRMGEWVQVSRLGNPLVNEVVIPLAEKDTFNASEPTADARFLEHVQNPILAELLPVLYPDVFGECLPANPREDLVAIYLTGIPDLNQPPNVAPAELLRLNTAVEPTPFAEQDPMGLLAGQLDGFPNGRRPVDDVVDISLQAVAGATPLGECAGVSPNNILGDGVVGNDRGYLDTFPYLPDPHSGYSHDHDHLQDTPIEAPDDGETDPDPMEAAQQAEAAAGQALVTFGQSTDAAISGIEDQAARDQFETAVAGAVEQYANSVGAAVDRFEADLAEERDLQVARNQLVNSLDMARAELLNQLNMAKDTLTDTLNKSGASAEVVNQFNNQFNAAVAELSNVLEQVKNQFIADIGGTGTEAQASSSGAGA